MPLTGNVAATRAPKPPLDVHPPTRAEPNCEAGADAIVPGNVNAPGEDALEHIDVGHVAVKVVAVGTLATIHAPVTVPCPIGEPIEMVPCTVAVAGLPTANAALAAPDSVIDQVV